MSRSNIPKSRAEKGKAVSSTPAVAHEIIAGKYNDQDWNFMLDRDEGDDFATDIVEEVCASAIDIIFQNYIEQQLVPYTVCQAKDAILQIIEWQFLSRDDGERNADTDPGWIEDEEPEPAVTDCWAQGSVPKQKRTINTPETVLEEDEEPQAESPTVEEEITEEVPRESPTITCIMGLTDEVSEEKIEEEGSVPTEEEIVETPSENKPKGKSPKKIFKPYTGRLRSAGVGKMTESLEDTEVLMKQQEEAASASPSKTPDPATLQMPSSCHSIIKLQAGRPPGNRDVLFDEHGNAISIFKIDPEKLPNHKVKTGYRVVDPDVEAAQARLEAMRTGRYVTNGKVPQPPSTAKTSRTRHSVSMTNTQSIASQSTVKQVAGKESRAYNVVPLPPPMIDSMDIAPGVIVKEGDRMKNGPKQHGRQLEAVIIALQKGLQPIQKYSKGPTITVAELLEHQTPVVKPLENSAPIPPIRHTQQLGS